MNRKNINRLKKIEQLIEDNIGKVLTDDTATDIYQLTNELMCSNRHIDHIGIIELENGDINVGYRPSRDITGMIKWKEEMDVCNDVEECTIYRIEEND